MSSALEAHTLADGGCRQTAGKVAGKAAKTATGRTHATRVEHLADTLEGRSRRHQLKAGIVGFHDRANIRKPAVCESHSHRRRVSATPSRSVRKHGCARYSSRLAGVRSRRCEIPATPILYRSANPLHLAPAARSWPKRCRCDRS